MSFIVNPSLIVNATNSKLLHHNLLLKQPTWHKCKWHVGVFWANHITLHCMGGHFVSGASLHRECYRTLWWFKSSTSCTLPRFVLNGVCVLVLRNIDAAAYMKCLEMAISLPSAKYTSLSWWSQLQLYYKECNIIYFSKFKFWNILFLVNCKNMEITTTHQENTLEIGGQQSNINIKFQSISVSCQDCFI